MQYSNIQWCDFTSNPLQYRTIDGKVAWGCIHKSAGCEHCYAETLAKRYGRGLPFTAQNMKDLTPFLSEKELRHMLTYKPASGKRVFCGDMTDLFGEWVPFELLDQLFAVFALRQDVTWQILTKRPERMLDYLHNRLRKMAVGYALDEINDEIPCGLLKQWPLPNVWLGVSCEDQKSADTRIPLLLQTPAAVRFISAEPLLDVLNICRWIEADWSPTLQTWKWSPVKIRPYLDWVIVGGESGPKSRPLRPHWARSIVGPCKAAKVPVFVKQMGSNVQERNDQIADIWVYADGSDMDTEALYGDSYRYQGAPVRIKLKDRKGGDMAEWPEDLRVREFPTVS